MATVQIHGTLLGNLGARDRIVTATLVDLNGTPQLGYVADVEGEIVTEISTSAGPNGSWSMELYGNADVASDFGDTLYRITEGPGFNRFGSNTYYVGVPTSGGPYWAVDLKVTPPGGAAPETFAVVSVDGFTGAVDLSGRYLQLGGGTLTGALTLSGDPVSDLQAATKQYVDNNAGGGGPSGGPYLPLSGGTLSGALTLSGDPSEALEAATKQYVDAVATDLDNETVRATAAEALLAPKDNPTFTGTVSGITKSMVGLGNVDNTSDANKPVSTATQIALDLKAPLASPTFTGTVSGVTKSMVGLGNVDNTSDANKPVSTATQTALNLKANLASPTFTGTVTTDDLDVDGDLAVSGIGQRQYIRATSDQTFTSTSQVASNYLSLPVVANGVYRVTAGVIILSSGGNFRPSWTGPSGATMKWNNTTASADYSSTIGATNGFFPALATPRMIFLEGLLQVSSSSGNITFTASSASGATTIYADSYLIVDRVA
jgi:hypothetical protein